MTHNDTRTMLNLAALIFGAVLGLLAAVALSGCATSRSDIYAALDEIIAAYDEWQAQRPPKPAEPSAPAEPTPDTPAAPADDALDYALLRWSYGGFHGAGAVRDLVTLADLRLDAGGARYRWDVDLSAWGIAHTDADALACAFLRNESGAWVGGKFDWVSSSRTYRDFKHFGSAAPSSGYNGWSLQGIPNPTQLALVVVSRDGRRRSNVLVGEWRR